MSSLPPMICFINGDITYPLAPPPTPPYFIGSNPANTTSYDGNDELTNLKLQLFINESMTKAEFDARIAVDPNYSTVVHLQGLRILVILPDFHDRVNRRKADVVVFLHQGLADVLRNRFGWPRDGHNDYNHRDDYAPGQYITNTYPAPINNCQPCNPVPINNCQPCNPVPINNCQPYKPIPYIPEDDGYCGFDDDDKYCGFDDDDDDDKYCGFDDDDDDDDGYCGNNHHRNKSGHPGQTYETQRLTMYELLRANRSCNEFRLPFEMMPHCGSCNYPFWCDVHHTFSGIRICEKGCECQCGCDIIDNQGREFSSIHAPNMDNEYHNPDFLYRR